MNPAVLADLIRVVNAPDHPAWLVQVQRIGGCAHPLHMTGYTRRRDATGRVIENYSSADQPGGVILVPCRNRRASVCPVCAALYRGDTYALVLAGLIGGKGIPDSVTAHLRVFATLTAPGFGAVHTHRTTAGGGPAPCHPRRTGSCPHGADTSCMTPHTPDDPLVGVPLCPECYDYPAAVIWQANLGILWARFTTYLPRHLAKTAGITHARLRAQVRLSYIKIVEYQRRGLVHVHAVIRVDSPTAPGAPIRPGPVWVTADLLTHAITAAAQAVRVHVDGGIAGSWTLCWGQQLDVQELTPANAMADGTDTMPEADAGGATAQSVAAYVAKYATKGTEITGWTGDHLDGTPRSAHAQRMITTAAELSAIIELTHLNLGRWAKTLAYRGHVSSKYRRYSTTLIALRAARADYVRRAKGRPDPTDAETSGVVTESAWRLIGHGYTPGQALLAADIARDAAANRHAAREAGISPTPEGSVDGRARGRA
ncbi:MAG: plasmid replication initiator protein [Actinomycetales bacterium]|nr:plasmid replication initiator protein [Actinomycetales bacterium]